MKTAISSMFVMPLLLPAIVFGAEECICNTSEGSGVSVPFAEVDCDLPEARTHPDDASVEILECIWVDPAAAATPDLSPAGTTSSSDSTAEQGASNGPETSNISGQLRSLNKLGTTNVPTVIGRALVFLTGIYGSLTMVMIVYGGLLIMTSGANSEKVKKGSRVIMWTSIAFVTMMSAYAIVRFILRFLV